MTLKECLYFLTLKLKNGQILNSRFESELILASALRCTREELYLIFEKNLSLEEEKKATLLLQRRLSGEPLAYILEKKFFYKSSFFVNSHVLIPRDETEVLLRTAIEWSLSKSSETTFNGRCIRVLDMGVGSGCLGLSFLKEFENAFLVAVDVSKEALNVARLNAKSLGVIDRLHFIHQKVETLNSKSLPDFFNGKLDVILANPPYINEDLRTVERKKKENFLDVKSGVEKSVVDFEPHEALFSPCRGSQHLFSWSEVAFRLLDRPSIYVCEVGTEDQIKELKKELEEKKLFNQVFIKQDLSGRKRMLGCVKK